MKCPHCNHVASHKVVETRKFEGDVYRRRRCEACSGAFVSVETAPRDMTMPTMEAWKFQNRERRLARGLAVRPYEPGTVHKQASQRPAKPAANPRDYGLQDVWR